MVLTALALLMFNGTVHAGDLYCIAYPYFCLPSHSPMAAPEIDAGTAASGVTMLVASAYVIVDRFRRR